MRSPTLTRSSRSQYCVVVVPVVEISRPQVVRFFEIAAVAVAHVLDLCAPPEVENLFGLPQRSDFYRLAGLVLVKMHSRDSRKTGTIYNPISSVRTFTAVANGSGNVGLEKDSALACNRVNSATLRY